MSDDFYRAFEEKYRGSRELIKSRLTAYHPFLESVLSIYPKARALDLGCGRGEWLEYVAEQGFSGFGVDLDEGMLAACIDRGISAEKSDLLDCLKKIESESVALVSAFHVVEHISFHDLRVLIAEAMRVLKPGGLLIMETPNPENIVVATRSFYLDPTHEKPIPAELLVFVAEFTGFHRVKTIRLQESKELLSKGDINVREVLNGVSPDYAIVAQKSAEPEVIAKFDDAFNQDYGLSLDVLAARFDDRLSRVEAKASEAEAKASEVVVHLNAVFNSRSWQITAPLRWTVFQVQLIKKHGIVARIKSLYKKIIFFIKKLISGMKFLLVNRFLSLFFNALTSYIRNKPKLLVVVKWLISRPVLRDIPFKGLIYRVGRISETGDMLTANHKFSDFLDYDFFKTKNLNCHFDFHHSNDYELFKCVSNDVGVYLDFDLIKALRSGGKVFFKRRVSESDRSGVDQLSIHIYLAYLRRFPDSHSMSNLSSSMINHQSVDIAIKNLRNSPEFISSGYRVVEL